MAGSNEELRVYLKEGTARVCLYEFKNKKETFLRVYERVHCIHIHYLGFGFIGDVEEGYVLRIWYLKRNGINLHANIGRPEHEQG